MSKTTTAEEFPFDEIRRLVAAGRPGTAGSLILRSLNTMLVARDFAGVDRVLAVAPLDDITPANLLCYLTITSHAERYLPDRPAFVERARPWLIARVGEDRAARLLANRE